MILKRLCLAAKVEPTFLIKWIHFILFLQISSTNLSATSCVQGVILGARDTEVNGLVS